VFVILKLWFSNVEYVYNFFLIRFSFFSISFQRVWWGDESLLKTAVEVLNGFGFTLDHYKTSVYSIIKQANHDELKMLDMLDNYLNQQINKDYILEGKPTSLVYKITKTCVLLGVFYFCLSNFDYFVPLSHSDGTGLRWWIEQNPDLMLIEQLCRDFEQKYGRPPCLD